MDKELTYAQLADALHELWLWARDTKAVSPQHLEVLRQASLVLDTEWRRTMGLPRGALVTRFVPKEPAVFIGRVSQAGFLDSDSVLVVAAFSLHEAVHQILQMLVAAAAGGRSSVTISVCTVDRNTADVFVSSIDEDGTHEGQTITVERETSPHLMFR